MATIVARAAPVPGRSATPPPHLTFNTSSRGTPAAVPNKHIPVCPPGPRPARTIDTPSASTADKTSQVDTSTITYPPDRFARVSDDPPVYSIDAPTVAKALEEKSSQSLPDPAHVFPWLHGLHAENQIQLSFFFARRKAQRKVPKGLRTITIVKAGGDLSISKLKGAVPPEEILQPEAGSMETGEFIECDPKEGFSVRNFQIQVCKMATVSDIFVYSDDHIPKTEVVRLARRLSRAQKAWRERLQSTGSEMQEFNTFVVSDPFSAFEKKFRDLVAVDSRGCLTGNVVDFFYFERLEMCIMSEASEITTNVFLGPTPDPTLDPRASDDSRFDVLIEASDVASIPSSKSLKQLVQLFEDPDHASIQIEFPSSGSILPPTWSQRDVDGLLGMVRWIYQIANPDDLCDRESDKDSDSDSIMTSGPFRPQKVLIHCTDGYTESSLLGLAYFMYAEGLPVHEAWVCLHRERGRNFFAYPSDVALLNSIQHRILQESPRWQGDILSINEPRWLSRIDGSLPSRILPYMYLGNLGHANNPELLKELGITRILSVGEPISWSHEINDKWPAENLLYIDRVQDNGVDALTEEFDRCLKFIERGKLDGAATLVHCRVGVSRSATICIAEVMNELGLSFPRAYCFVRARRLNVIIQPHLRFTYELLKWEEYQRQKRREPLRRELEWATIAREIALMNKPYSKQ